jgi:hypothetical protein
MIPNDSSANTSSDEYRVMRLGVSPADLMPMIYALRSGATCLFNGVGLNGNPVRGRIVATHPESCSVTLIA